MLFLHAVLFVYIKYTDLLTPIKSQIEYIKHSSKSHQLLLIMDGVGAHPQASIKSIYQHLIISLIWRNTLRYILDFLLQNDLYIYRDRNLAQIPSPIYLVQRIEIHTILTAVSLPHACLAAVSRLLRLDGLSVSTWCTLWKVFSFWDILKRLLWGK